MADNPQSFTSAVMTLPAFGKTPQITLDMNKTREAETRFIEAKTVNPVTYVDLEHAFNESYRELKRHVSTVGYQITMAEKALKQAKAAVLLDKYPDFMKDKPKSHDSSDMREAYLMRDEEYLAALDRFNQLKAVESFVDGRIKVIENVCRFMRKQMDLTMRSGLSDRNLYLTQGKK